MDNNFDENRQVSNNSESPSEETVRENPSAEASEPPVQQVQEMPEGQGFQAGEGNSPQQPAQGFPGMQGIPNGGFQPYPQYAPNQGAAYSFYQEPQKKKFSGGWFWGLIVLAAVFLAVIVILCVMISSQVSSMRAIKEQVRDNENGAIFDFSAENNDAKSEHIEIKLPTSRKPVLDEELYQNKETGLLTTVGVAKMVLPSQVKIEIFGEIPYAPLGSGSGVIISSDGYIVTNAHVVDGANSISVKFYDDSTEEAVLVGMDKKSDLAVVKVDRDDLPSAEIGTSADLVIGEEIALAGAGGGFENTVTYGHVTGLDREINTNYMSSVSMNCIQTDAALNYGNSGGALVNMYGQVVGIAVALMEHDTFENIGFSIAIDDAVPIIEELISKGYVSSRSMVGISYLAVGDSMASSYEITPGLCVTEIRQESFAADAGIMLYDIITQIDDVRVFGGEEVAEALKGKIPGDTVRLTVFRKSVTGKNSIFETDLELIPDRDSARGSSETVSAEEFYSRAIVQ